MLQPGVRNCRTRTENLRCEERACVTFIANSSMATAILRVVPPEDVKPLINDPVDELTRGQSAAIVDQVRSEGEAGLISIAQKFGDIEAGKNEIFPYARMLR